MNNLIEENIIPTNTNTNDTDNTTDNIVNTDNTTDNTDNTTDNMDEVNVEIKKENIILPKKRGRKPKNSKLITEQIEQKQPDILKMHIIEKPNVILHLKCSLNDLENDIKNSEFLKTNIYSNENSFTQIESLEKDINYLPFLKSETNFDNNINYYNINNSLNETFTEDYKTTKKDDNIIDKKLSQLQNYLNKNDIHKSSCCFWCTYDFKTNPIYIPKYIYKNTYNVYGNFCSPECAAGFLMNEKIDSSIKFERYALLNNLYSEIFNYNTNIKCAPEPYYLLNKYCGNLTIDEYRNLNKNKQIFILDKPLTKIMPELHQEKNIGF